jgi:hypothetical protein
VEEKLQFAVGPSRLWGAGPGFSPGAIWAAATAAWRSTESVHQKEVAMTGSARDARIEERANQLLRDDDALAAFACYVNAQLRYRRIRRLLARLRSLVWLVTVMSVAIASAGITVSLLSGQQQVTRLPSRM